MSEGNLMVLKFTEEKVNLEAATFRREAEKCIPGETSINLCLESQTTLSKTLNKGNIKNQERNSTQMMKFESNKLQPTKGPWTKEEDELLDQLVTKLGA